LADLALFNKIVRVVERLSQDEQDSKVAQKKAELARWALATSERPSTEWEREFDNLWARHIQEARVARNQADMSLEDRWPTCEVGALLKYIAAVDRIERSSLRRNAALSSPSEPASASEAHLPGYDRAGPRSAV